MNGDGLFHSHFYAVWRQVPVVMTTTTYIISTCCLVYLVGLVVFTAIGRRERREDVKSDCVDQQVYDRDGCNVDHTAVAAAFQLYSKNALLLLCLYFVLGSSFMCMYV